MGYGSPSSWATVISVPTLNRCLLIGENRIRSLADELRRRGALLFQIPLELRDRVREGRRPVRHHDARQLHSTRAGEKEADDVGAVACAVRADDRELPAETRARLRDVTQRERQRPGPTDRSEQIRRAHVCTTRTP